MTNAIPEGQPPNPADVELDDSVLGTMQIDPDMLSPKVNRNPFSRLKYSLAGTLHMMTRHGSVRMLMLTTIVVLPLAAWLRLSTIQWALLVFSGGMVWVTEFLNTAVESAIDIATNGQIHPLAKVGEDVGSAATFMASLVATVVLLLVLVPMLMRRL